jgi:class 3 adenylate cyclase/tetratricopeptide (TPR) repeat protein
VSICPKCGADNPQQFRLCGFCGARLVDPGPERRKLATLLFCDMSSSTAIGERVDAESVRDMMFRYFHTMRSAIEHHGGTVEKFVGDAVMAVFGVPTSHEDDALRALRAAREMHERMTELNAELERRFGATIVLRIGVNTGEVVAGDASLRETMVTGDAVNVAARLEQAAEPGEILIGPETYRLTREAVTVSPVTPLTLKGKSEPVAAYRLLGTIPASSPPGRRLEKPMIGRGEELAFLRQAFTQAASERTCRLVTIVGEPGVGKSRLAAELAAAVVNDARILGGRCLSYGEGITFWPVGEIVREAASIRDEDSQDEARARIAALLAGRQDGPLVAERVAQSIGLAGGQGAIEEIAWAIRKLFETLASSRPLLLLVDDIHWAESALLDLLASLPRLSTDAPILLLCLARQDLLEARPDWEATIRLEPLADTESERLLADLLGGGNVEESIRRRIVRATEGNPLFLEELVAMLVDEGLLRQANGSWAATGELAEVTIPPNLNALLGARLDRLRGPERAALERGAIEGQTFHRGAVAALSPPEAQPDLAAHLDSLVSKEFLRPAQATFAGEAAFRFRHILIRDAAYRATAKKTRGELHERFADWLEWAASDRVREYEEILGYHLEQAYRYRTELGPVDEGGREVARRAAERLATAGLRASALGDVPAAANLLGRATSLLPPGSRERVELLPEQTRALRWLGDLVGARAIAAETVQEAAITGDRRLKLHALMLELALRRLSGTEAIADELIRTAEQAVPFFERLGDEKGLVYAWANIGTGHSDLGRVSLALDANERALEHAVRAGDSHWQALLLGEIACGLCQGRAPVADGISRCRDTLVGVSKTPHPAIGFLPLRAEILAVLSLLEAMNGSFEEARKDYEESKAIYGELGRSWDLAAWVPLFSGQVELLGGDPLQAEQELAPGVAALERMEVTGHLASLAPLLADALCSQARYDEAYGLSKTSEELAAPGDMDAQVRWRTVRAKVLAVRGECDRAEALVRKAVDLAAATEFTNLHADALMVLGQVLNRTGTENEAEVAVRCALELYERKGNVVSADRARTVLARLAPA